MDNQTHERIKTAARKVAWLWVQQIAWKGMQSATTQPEQSAVTPQKLDVFKAELIKGITGRLEATEQNQVNAFINSQHQHDTLLIEAAELAGIKTSALPLFSHVQIRVNDNKIRYVFGFGKAGQEIAIQQ